MINLAPNFKVFAGQSISILSLSGLLAVGSAGTAHAHGTHVAPPGPRPPAVHSHDGPFSVLHQGPLPVLHQGSGS